MARGELNSEAEALQGFLVVLIDHLARTEPAAAGLLEELKGIVQGTNRVAGLRMVASDVLEIAKDIAGPELAELDSGLIHAGLPSLSFMRSGQARKVLAIMKRGRIRNDDEYRLVASRVGDIEDRTLSLADRERAGNLLLEYEASKA